VHEAGEVALRASFSISFVSSEGIPPEDVAILKKGVDAWNTWRGENPDILPDLGAANLRGANLSEADLSHAKFTGANLSEANLWKAKLIEADLVAANLASSYVEHGAPPRNPLCQLTVGLGCHGSTRRSFGKLEMF
jgi:uncharacterized protein YjbI with pentapeptide repeats